MAEKFSLVTNASAKDAPRLTEVLPHWIRVFGPRLAEISVLLDLRPAEGRIKKLHAANHSPHEVIERLDQLSARYPVIRWHHLEYTRLADVSRVWWKAGRPIRCQDGSPVFAFAAAVLSAGERFVLRADCDMLFQEQGWLNLGLRTLSEGECDIVSPPRLGCSPDRLSSRALLFDWPSFRRRFLPIKAARLGWARQIHRRLHGRPVWLAFEDSLMALVKSGAAKFRVLPSELGASMHVVRINEMAEPRFSRVLECWERGLTPADQLDLGWDYHAEAWAHSELVPAGKVSVEAPNPA